MKITKDLRNLSNQELANKLNKSVSSAHKDIKLSRPPVKRISKIHRDILKLKTTIIEEVPPIAEKDREELVGFFEYLKGIIGKNV